MRLRCVVPFCRRTTGRTVVGKEWICGKHWLLIPKVSRRVYGRRIKRWRRYRTIWNVKAADRLWFWMKRKATERAMGL